MSDKKIIIKVGEEIIAEYEANCEVHLSEHIGVASFSDGLHITKEPNGERVVCIILSENVDHQKLVDAIINQIEREISI